MLGPLAPAIAETDRLLTVLSNPKKMREQLTLLCTEVSNAQAAADDARDAREKLRVVQDDLKQREDALTVLHEEVSKRQAQLRVKDTELRAEAAALSLLQESVKVKHKSEWAEIEKKWAYALAWEERLAIEAGQTTRASVAAKEDERAAASLRSEYEAKLAKLKEAMG